MTSLRRPPALLDELEARSTSALCAATAIAQPVQGPRQGVDLVAGMAVFTSGEPLRQVLHSLGDGWRLRTDDEWPQMAKRGGPPTNAMVSDFQATADGGTATAGLNPAPEAGA